MNVNQKGNIGLIKVINELYSDKIVKYHCFLPFDDHSPVDLVAMDANTGEIFRIQVKYRSPMESRNGAYEIPAYSVVNGKKIKIDKNLIDYWAIYLSDRNEVVFLNVELMKNKSTHYIRSSHLLGDDYKFVQKTLKD